MSAHKYVSTTTSAHTITIENDYLTINGDGETLGPDEAEQLHEVLNIWQYGFEVVSDEDLEK